MTARISRSIALAIVAGALALGGCKKVPDTADGEQAVSQAREADGTLASAIAEDDSLSTAAALIAKVDLDDMLGGSAPYTLFLPSDSAFDALPAGLLKTLQVDEAKPVLTSLISGHIVPGTVTAGDIDAAIKAEGGSAMLKTMAGDVLTFTRDGDRLLMAAPDGEAVAISDKAYQADNGVVHVIDAVLVRN